MLKNMNFIFLSRTNNGYNFWTAGPISNFVVPVAFQNVHQLCPGQRTIVVFGISCYPSGQRLVNS